MLPKLQTNVYFLGSIKMGWALFLINIVCGILLFLKESLYYNEELLREGLFEFDNNKINDTDKDRKIALLMLHKLRVAQPKELGLSKYAYSLIDKYKTQFDSWNIVKNPEKFYSFENKKYLNRLTMDFYATFVGGLFSLLIAVMLFQV
jgi:hypothetical protein